VDKVQMKEWTMEGWTIRAQMEQLRSPEGSAMKNSIQMLLVFGQ